MRGSATGPRSFSRWRRRASLTRSWCSTRPDDGAADRPVRPYAQQQSDAGDFAVVVDADRRTDVQDRHACARALEFVGRQPARRRLGHVRHWVIILQPLRIRAQCSPWCLVAIAITHNVRAVQRIRRPSGSLGKAGWAGRPSGQEAGRRVSRGRQATRRCPAVDGPPRARWRGDGCGRMRIWRFMAASSDSYNQLPRRHAHARRAHGSPVPLPEEQTRDPVVLPRGCRPWGTVRREPCSPGLSPFRLRVLRRRATGEVAAAEVDVPEAAATSRRVR